MQNLSGLNSRQNGRFSFLKSEQKQTLAFSLRDHGLRGDHFIAMRALNIHAQVRTTGRVDDLIPAAISADEMIKRPIAGDKDCA